VIGFVVMVAFGLHVFSARVPCPVRRKAEGEAKLYVKRQTRRVDSEPWRKYRTGPERQFVDLGLT